MPENHKKNQSSDSLYLQQLVFKPEDGKTWLNFFIKNFRVTVLIVFGLLLWGYISFQMLPLESNPEVKIPYGVVSVVLPGASPADVEELIVKRIEEKVINISGVKKVSSSALNSFASITVEFRAEEDIKDALRRLRDAVEAGKSSLPAEASEPTVSEVSFSSAPVWTLVVTGPYDNFTLRKYAESIQKELEKIPGTADVMISGGDIAEIRIIYDPLKLQTFNLTLDQIHGVLRAGNIALPLGTFNISDYEYTLRTEAEYTNAAELRKLPIMNLNGQIIRLQDVAVVAEMSRKRDVYNYFSLEKKPPQNAVTLNVVKKTGSSIIELVDKGKEKIKELQQQKLPANIDIETTLDYSQIIRRDFDQLMHDGVLTIGLVALILFLFVGLKEAFVAGLAVPLVFSATFGLMYVFGITLNFLSIFALILSLGLLVDDAIVVVQATKQYLKTGKFTPEEAVLLVFHDYKVLLTTTTLTTIWAFLPLVLASGIIGQFIRSIPLTVSITLAASYFIAIIINHPMAIILERFRVTRIFFKIPFTLLCLGFIGSIMVFATGYVPFAAGLSATAILGITVIVLFFHYRRTLKAKLLINENLILEERADPVKIKNKIAHHYLEENQNSFWSRLIGGVIKLEKLLPYFGRFLFAILKSKAKSAVVLMCVVVVFFCAAGLPAFNILKSEFIPPSDSENMYINIQAPAGLVTAETKKIADQVEKILLQENTLRSFAVVVGAKGVNLSGGGRGGITGSGGQTHYAQFALNLYPLLQRPQNQKLQRQEKSYEIAKRLRKDIESVKGAKIEVVEVSGGPPSGAEFEAHLAGENLQTLEREANRYKDILSQIPGTINEKISLTLSPGEFTFKLNHDQMQLRGLTAFQVASTLRAAISGVEVAKILKEGKEITVNAEFSQERLPTLDALKNLPLSNGRGQTFPLSDIAEVQIGSSVTAINRVDQKRDLTLSAGVEKPYLPGEVLKAFQEKIKEYPLPEGYEITFGGQNETNAESVYSILWAMLAAMILIIGTLIIQFNSFTKAILVLATIPLALTGVFFGLTITGQTLSFPALIGVLALFGIVVKNAVILVDKINLNLRVGIPFYEAIVDAAQSRLEAIFLTSISTIIGIIPITLSSETWRGLGTSLIFGLSASTFLTLFAIPILFALFTKKSHEKDMRIKELTEAAEKRKLFLRATPFYRPSDG